MDYQEKQLNKHLSNLSELDKLLLLRKLINSSISNFKSKEKALKAEFNYEGCRTGVRGGKRTTLSAKASNSAEMYVKSIEFLKLAVNKI